MGTDFTYLLTLAAIIVPIVEIAGLLTAWHAIVHVRSAQGSIAWAIGLITFPWLALPIYWVFGRNKFHGYVETLRKGQEQHDQATRAIINRFLEEHIVPRGDLGADLRVFENLAGMPFNQGNRAELLVDGPATFGAMFDRIKTARKYILLQYFIVHDDELGRELRDILVRKAKDGVDVYFQYDEIGSHSLPKAYLRSLKQAGVHVNTFHTAKGRGNRFQLNFRNHRKITVVDGHTAFVGGHNIGDEYMGRDPRFGRWRDTHVEIHGPVIRQIQLSFVKDWFWSRGELIPLNWDSAISEKNGVDMLTLSTGPADKLDTCSILFVQAIHSAKTRMWLASPYFVPNEAVLEALQIAALRGVDVRIVLPEKPDHRTVYLAGLSFFPQLNLPGIRVYRYTDGFLHQKVMLVDDYISIVGTANADNRSFRLNFEIMMLVADRAFAADMQKMLEEDFNNSRIVEVDEFLGLGVFTRLGVRIARLLSPLL